MIELERRILATMAENPGSWAGLVAQELGEPTRTVSDRLHKLWYWGYITRVDSITDVKRRWDVTAKGHAALAAAGAGSVRLDAQPKTYAARKEGEDAILSNGLRPQADRWAAYLKSQIAFHEGTYQEAMRRGDDASAGRCAARARAVMMVADAWRTGDY